MPDLNQSEIEAFARARVADRPVHLVAKELGVRPDSLARLVAGGFRIRKGTLLLFACALGMISGPMAIAATPKIGA